MCMGEAPAIAALYDWLYQHYHQQIHIYKSRPTYLELATNEVSKASGMTLIMRNHLHGTNDQAIAYGDNFNDIEMLRAAGIGVSVENAIQEVKEVAAEITAAGKDDGVARSLEKHFQLVWES
jgi:hydroxymethylpyrimidine pyrophosphatase-like HAD family hydrolase